MKKTLKKTIIAAAALSVLFINGSAHALDCSVRYDYANQNIVISGTPDAPGDFISLQIIKEGKTFETAEDEDFIYTGQTTADSDFVFDFDYDVPMGKYPARLATSAGEQTIDINLMVISKEELQDIYAELNELSESAPDAFYAKVNENIAYLTGDAEAEKISEESLENYLSYVKNNKLTVDKSAENTKILNTFLVIEDLNNNKIKNIDSKIASTYIIEDGLIEEYTDVCDEDKISEYFTQKLSGNNISTLEEYDAALKEALVLTAANYGSGYGQLQKLTEKYADALGIDSKASSSVYKELFGNEYKDAKDYCDAWAEAKKSAGSSSGSGSSGSGSSKGSSGKNNMVVATTSGESDIVKPMNVVFDDIDGVEWATVAIHTLADKNIINGKEPRKFSPNDAVTREEFVKILIGAMNLSESEYNGNSFVDVSDSDWFLSYVNIANEKGIVRGIGNSMFGAGSKITRQDMAVMLYNALKFKNVEVTAGELPFADKNQIAEYAKEAVSVLYKMGAVNGISDTEFAPFATATRAQAAKIIYEVLDYLG